MYEGYFDELWKVKSILTYYNKVQEIIKQQGQIADEYSHAWQLTQQDENFTIEELEYIYKVYMAAYSMRVLKTLISYSLLLMHLLHK